MKYQNLSPFYSFIDALNYHRHCPLCHDKMELYDMRARSEYDYEQNKIIFELDEINGNTLHINYRTEEVELIISQNHIMLYGANPSSISYNSRMGNSYIRCGGEIGRAIHICCMNKECGQFSYTLQVWADLKAKRLSGVYLNSEQITLDEDGTTYEIKNVYTSDKTYYSYHAKDGVSKITHIPLIKLNLSKPNETLERIKNLIIFS